MMMDPDEKEVARSIVDWMTSGDEKLPSKFGALTLHSKREVGAFFASTESVIMRVEGRRDDEYEVTITARRRT